MFIIGYTLAFNSCRYPFIDLGGRREHGKSKVPCPGTQYNDPLLESLLIVSQQNVLLIQRSQTVLHPTNVFATFPSQIRIPKLIHLDWFNTPATYLFSIIIRSCFLDGDISEMYIYSVNMLRTENQVLCMI